MNAYQEIVPTYAFKSSQPNRLHNQTECHEIVISPSFLMGEDHDANKGIDATQTATAGNFPDHRANLALVSAYLLAATNKDFGPLQALKHTIGIRNGTGTPDAVHTGSGKVRPHLERLARLRQIRLYAMGWKRLLRSNQEDDPRIAHAFSVSAQLLQEVMKQL